MMKQSRAHVDESDTKAEPDRKGWPLLALLNPGITV